MTRDEALKKAINIVRYFEANFAKSKEARKDAADIIEALEKEPCGDCIRREDALMALTGEYTDSPIEILSKAVKRINSLSPVTPAEKVGQWILKRTSPTTLYGEHLNEYKCSECYREIRCTESQLVNYPYCHCGAKMQEVAG